MLKFNDKYVYRTPLRPVAAFAEGENFESIDAYLKFALKDREVQEAIFGSSPSFYTEVERFLIGDFYETADPKKVNKFHLTALKYLNRMSYRATPYGYFAGVGCGEVLDSRTPKTDVTARSFKRVVKLDTAYLMYFANEFAAQPGINGLLTYYPNNTIMPAGAKSRYVEYIDSEKGRAYNLSIFTNSEYTGRVLEFTENGASGSSIADIFSDDDISHSEGMAFVEQLASARILISELEPFIVGQTFQEQLGDILGRLSTVATPNSSEFKIVNRYQQHLQQLLEALKKIAEGGQVKSYREVLEIVAAFHGKPYDNVIRLDAAIETKGVPHFDFNTARHIQKGIKAFTKLCKVSQSPTTAAFRIKFQQRYEDQFVPVLLALDPELGVGFENVGSEMFSFAPLVDNLPVARRLAPTMKKKVEWDYGLHSFFMGKIVEAATAGSKVIDLSDADLDQFSYDLKHLPPTSAAMLKLVPQADGEKPLVVFQDLGKDTGTALISRFAHLSGELEDVVNKLSDFEEEAFPGCTVAEVNHLANIRIGNITERPRSRKHEIAFITKSNSREEGLIAASDIYVGVRNNRVILVNQKTGKEIIPRVSTAHNYAYNCLPVYKFLACLQEEYHQGYYEYTLNLGNIAGMVDFIPRIQYENFIFRLASWKIPTHPIRKLKEQSFSNFHEQLKALFAEEGWPAIFTLHDKGSPVHIDINNHLGAFLLANMIGEQKIFISESIGSAPEEQWFQAGKKGYHHEIILPFRNEIFKGKAPAVVPNFYLPMPDVPRSVTPSEDWLYLKIYAGAATVEKMVSEKLPVLMEDWKSTDKISSFFFLRLTDPDYHLRLRVKPTSYAVIGDILESFNTFFAPELDSGFIQKVQIDTYRREIERYGGPLTLPSEVLFGIDSDLVLRLKKILVAEVNKDYEWLLMFKVMTIYLDVFGLEGKERIDFLRERCGTFSYIFNTNKLQKRSLIQRYLNNQQAMEQMMDNIGSPFTDQIGLYQTMEWFRSELSEWYQENFQEVDVRLRTELLRSYIHMFVLRFSTGKNKLHEHVLFFFLERYYLQQGAKKARSISQNAL